jgi:hypothetical protein
MGVYPTALVCDCVEAPGDTTLLDLPLTIKTEWLLELVNDVVVFVGM